MRRVACLSEGPAGSVSLRGSLERMVRIAVIGHVEHVTLGTVGEVPSAGDIVHMQDARFLAGGGGGLAFSQLVRSDAEVHLFSAVGTDEGGERVARALRGTDATLHLAERDVPHPRVVVMVDAEGRRTIVVTAPPLQPRATDPLPWDLLASCDAVYFTGDDPATVVHARRAKVLVATARRSAVLAASSVVVDVLVGSASDPRENMPFTSLAPQPTAQVLTSGSRPTRVVTAGGSIEVPAPPAVAVVRGDYGAGDSFAAALTYFLARGLDVPRSVARAGLYGAAVLAHASPLDGQVRLTL